MDYKAFISYSHQADARLAPALQRALSRFAKPWYRLRSMRIFRDQTNLAASPGLWSSIESALDRSEYFVFLASSRAAQSPWVQKEIEWWLAHRSPRTLLTVLTDGTLHWDPAAGDFDLPRSSAIPRALSGAFTEEPLYVDLSWVTSVDDMSMRHTRFRQAMLDIAATLLGRPKDELDGEDVRAYRRNRRFAWGAASVLAVLLAVSIAAAWIARQQQSIALGRLAGLCKALDEAQVLADAENQGSVYHFKSEFAAVSEQCRTIPYKTWSIGE